MRMAEHKLQKRKQLSGRIDFRRMQGKEALDVPKPSRRGSFEWDEVQTKELCPKSFFGLGHHLRLYKKGGVLVFR